MKIVKQPKLESMTGNHHMVQVDMDADKNQVLIGVDRPETGNLIEFILIEGLAMMATTRLQEGIPRKEVMEGTQKLIQQLMKAIETYKVDNVNGN